MISYILIGVYIVYAIYGLHFTFKLFALLNGNISIEQFGKSSKDEIVEDLGKDEFEQMMDNFSLIKFASDNMFLCKVIIIIIGVTFGGLLPLLNLKNRIRRSN